MQCTAVDTLFESTQCTLNRSQPPARPKAACDTFTSQHRVIWSGCRLLCLRLYFDIASSCVNSLAATGDDTKLTSQAVSAGHSACEGRLAVWQPSCSGTLLVPGQLRQISKLPPLDEAKVEDAEEGDADEQRDATDDDVADAEEIVLSAHPGVCADDHILGASVVIRVIPVLHLECNRRACTRITLHAQANTAQLHRRSRHSSLSAHEPNQASGRVSYTFLARSWRFWESPQRQPL